MCELPLTLEQSEHFTATRNACHVCTPLGACLCFRGIEGAIPLLHGSQGCSTYIRRYLIGHFREPIDVASSNFSESAAIYGGGPIFTQAIENVIRQYKPAMIGIATTCLSETIGDDVRMYLHEFQRKVHPFPLPALVHVSTPSYRGTHADGFHDAVKASVAALAQGGPRRRGVNLLSGMISPADIRELKDLLARFELPCVLLPDYSDTLDGPSWDDYQRLPAGGTPLAGIAGMGQAQASFELGATLDPARTAAGWLETTLGVPRVSLGMPIGIRQTDTFLDALANVAGTEVPAADQADRGRLVDAYIDAHKYLSGKRAVVHGEEDLVVGLVSLLGEIGIRVVLCASGGRSGRMERAIRQIGPEADSIMVRSGIDFLELENQSRALAPDLLIGDSKGYPLARKLGLPLVRVGFPIHDRVGASRLRHLGYRGAHDLLDRICNELIAREQDSNPTGYMNM